MAVKIRMFAALRDLAGEASTTAAAGRLDDLLAQLRERYGPAFAEVLERSAVLVEGNHPGGDRRVEDGEEVALLPPVSGGGA